MWLQVMLGIYKHNLALPKPRHRFKVTTLFSGQVHVMAGFRLSIFTFSFNTTLFLLTGTTNICKYYSLLLDSLVLVPLVSRTGRADYGIRVFMSGPGVLYSGEDWTHFHSTLSQHSFFQPGPLISLVCLCSWHNYHSLLLDSLVLYNFIFHEYTDKDTCKVPVPVQ